MKRPLEIVLVLLLTVFFALYGLVGMRNFDLRMATLHDDDGPIFYAYAFKDPALFERDFPRGVPLSLLVHMKVITSAMVWIPALLWHYLNLDPYASTWLIALSQGALIGLSIYVLALAMIRKRAVAALAVIFAYLATPWNWNPTNYGADSSFNFLPYAANLVIAPVLLAFACLIRGRVAATWLLLAVGGLIHPGLGLSACTIVGIYWLWEGLRSPSPGLWCRLGGLAVAGVITVLPSRIVTLTIPGEPLPRAEIMAGLRQNQHIWPWGNEYLWPFSVQTTLKWLVLAALSWRWRTIFSREVQLLWVAALVSAVVIGLTHVVGAVGQIPLLLTLIGLRSFMWLALIALPLIMYYWVTHICSGDWLGAALSLLCLALPLYARQYALFLPLIAGLLLVDISQGHLSIWHFDLPAWGRRVLWSLTLCVLVVWSISFLAMPFNLEHTPGPVLEAVSQLTWTGISPVNYNAVGPLPAQSVRVQLLAVVALLSLGAWSLDRLRPVTLVTPSAKCYNALRSALVGLIVLIYGSRFVWLQWQAARIQSVSSDIYTLDVQLWAREHTSPSSLFVVPAAGGWRTMSLRPKLSPFTRESYAYIAPRQAAEHRARLLAFYGISTEEGLRLRGAEIYAMELQQFRSFAECDFLRFASEFGATHLVLPTVYTCTDKTQFALPLAYENPYYVVYELRSSSALGCDGENVTP